MAYRGMQIASRWRRWSLTVIRIGRQLTVIDSGPIRVALAHPRGAASAEFEAFLGSPVDFGAEADEIAFSAAARNLPVVSADPYLNESLVSYWEAALARRSEPPELHQGRRRERDPAASAPWQGAHRQGR